MLRKKNLNQRKEKKLQPQNQWLKLPVSQPRRQKKIKKKISQLTKRKRRRTK